MRTHSTYFGLLAEFGAAEIPLEDCCEKYFGIGPALAARRAAENNLPVPAYRPANSQKSGWKICANALANAIDEAKQEAQERYERARNGHKPTKPTTERQYIEALPVSDSPPASISQIEGLRQIPKHGPPPSVYFLCKGDEVVYVGQSVQPALRIADHVKTGEKDFDRVYSVAVPAPDLNNAESAFINHLKPSQQGVRKDGTLIGPSCSIDPLEVLVCHYQDGVLQ
jgi:hypothetical protein